MGMGNSFIPSNDVIWPHVPRQGIQANQFNTTPIDGFTFPALNNTNPAPLSTIPIPPVIHKPAAEQSFDAHNHTSQSVPASLTSQTQVGIDTPQVDYSNISVGHQGLASSEGVTLLLQGPVPLSDPSTSTASTTSTTSITSTTSTTSTASTTSSMSAQGEGVSDALAQNHPVAAVSRSPTTIDELSDTNPQDPTQSKESHPLPHMPVTQTPTSNLPDSSPQSDLPPVPEMASTNIMQADKRKPKPSKRNEAMDKIGTTFTAPPPQNEEVQQANTSIVVGNTAYIKHQLLQNVIEEGWSQCVEQWFDLEAALGYGLVAGTKAGLPATLRPGEYAKWSSKAKNGERPYKVIPKIQDSMEFGLAVVKWYNAIQPPFRRSSNGGMPTPNVVPPATTIDPWACLRRAGPNGLLSIMLVLQWWGAALPSRTPFQEDSRPLYKEVVTDVLAIFNAIKLSIGTAGKSGKRKRADDNNNNPAKTLRTE